MTLPSLLYVCGAQAVCSVFLATPAARPHPVLCAAIRGLTLFAVTTGHVGLGLAEMGAALLDETRVTPARLQLPLFLLRQILWWWLWQRM